MMDIDNVIVSKVYALDDSADPYTGTSEIAVNKNYVLHLLENPIDKHQVIRVFSRFSNLNSAARFELRIHTETTARYFAFPNSLFNYLVFRDERSINVTKIMDQNIILNGTNGNLVEKYKDIPILVHVTITLRGIVTYQKFKVSFVDRYNTVIKPMRKAVDSNNIDVFYNCGELEL